MQVQVLDLHIIDTKLERYSSICRRIITKILQIHNQSIINCCKYDRIYISTTMLNVIADSGPFFVYNNFLDFNESSPIGKLVDIDVYLKDNIVRNQIIFSYGKSKIRDSKIELILEENSNSNLEELILEIKSEFI